jgi:hypothetical protein
MNFRRYAWLVCVKVALVLPTAFGGALTAAGSILRPLGFTRGGEPVEPQAPFGSEPQGRRQDVSMNRTPMIEFAPLKAAFNHSPADLHL